MDDGKAAGPKLKWWSRPGHTPGPQSSAETGPHTPTAPAGTAIGSPRAECPRAGRHRRARRRVSFLRRAAGGRGLDRSSAGAWAAAGRESGARAARRSRGGRNVETTDGLATTAHETRGATAYPVRLEKQSTGATAPEAPDAPGPETGAGPSGRHRAASTVTLRQIAEDAGEKTAADPRAQLPAPAPATAGPDAVAASDSTPSAPLPSAATPDGPPSVATSGAGAHGAPAPSAATSDRPWRSPPPLRLRAMAASAAAPGRPGDDVPRDVLPRGACRSGAPRPTHGAATPVAPAPSPDPTLSASGAGSQGAGAPRGAGQAASDGPRADARIRQPLHPEDPYGTPPYGGPGPWAPAPPVQRPVPTPAHGTRMPPPPAGPQPAYGAPAPTPSGAMPPQVPQPPQAPHSPPAPHDAAGGRRLPGRAAAGCALRPAARTGHRRSTSTSTSAGAATPPAAGIGSGGGAPDGAHGAPDGHTGAHHLPHGVPAGPPTALQTARPAGPWSGDRGRP